MNRTRAVWRPVLWAIFFVGFMAAFRYFGSVAGALLIFSWILLPKAPRFAAPKMLYAEPKEQDDGMEPGRRFVLFLGCLVAAGGLFWDGLLVPDYWDGWVRFFFAFVFLTGAGFLGWIQWFRGGKS